MENSLFVDTSAWIALFNEDDKYHLIAQKIWQNLPKQRPRLITNDYVLDETYTILRRCRNGLSRAKLAHKVIEESKIIELIEVNSFYRQKGWRIFTKFDDKIVSFTDCICFAMMRELDIFQAFSFDSDFKRANFVILP